MQMLQAPNPGHSLRFSVPPSSPPPGCRTNSVHQQCCTTHDISYDRAAALVFFSFFLSFFCLHTFVSLADRDSYTFRLLTHTQTHAHRCHRHDNMYTHALLRLGYSHPIMCACRSHPTVSLRHQRRETQSPDETAPLATRSAGCGRCPSKHLLNARRPR